MSKTEGAFNLLKFFKLDNLTNNLRGYVEARLELYKLEIEEKITLLLVNTLYIACLSAVLILFFTFLTIGIALWIGHLLGGAYIGFFLVAAIYLLIFCILMFLKKHTKVQRGIKEAVSNPIKPTDATA